MLNSVCTCSLNFQVLPELSGRESISSSASYESWKGSGLKRVSTTLLAMVDTQTATIKCIETMRHTNPNEVMKEQCRGNSKIFRWVKNLRWQNVWLQASYSIFWDAGYQSTKWLDSLKIWRKNGLPGPLPTPMWRKCFFITEYKQNADGRGNFDGMLWK